VDRGAEEGGVDHSKIISSENIVIIMNAKLRGLISSNIKIVKDKNKICFVFVNHQHYQDFLHSKQNRININLEKERKRLYYTYLSLPKRRRSIEILFRDRA